MMTMITKTRKKLKMIIITIDRKETRTVHIPNHHTLFNHLIQIIHNLSITASDTDSGYDPTAAASTAISNQTEAVKNGK